MKLLIKFPTRFREKKFRNTLDRYYKFLSGKHDYEFIISMNENDPSMNNIKMKKYLLNKENLKYFYGKFRNKVEAINGNLDNVDFDVLLLASDDMIPIVKGYDDIIMKNMKKYFSNTDGVLHFNDGRRGKRLNTLSIMGKKFYDRFGYIYHPDYTSFYCDDEFTEVTKKMKKCRYINQVIIRHSWVEYTGKDFSYMRNLKYMHLDQRVYAKRKKRGFPKSRIS
jgi:hypothetical protein